MKGRVPRHVQFSRLFAEVVQSFHARLSITWWAPISVCVIHLHEKILLLKHFVPTNHIYENYQIKTIKKKFFNVYVNVNFPTLPRYLD